MVKKFYRKLIPLLDWSPYLSDLFNDLKKCITTSPVLAQFDPLKLTFLKIDLSSEGIGLIIMQPTDDDESTKAAIHLKDIEECLFDLTKNGTRLKPVTFESRGCNENEIIFHSFSGKGACGLWAITQNKNICQIITFV